MIGKRGTNKLVNIRLTGNSNCRDKILPCPNLYQYDIFCRFCDIDAQMDTGDLNHCLGHIFTQIRGQFHGEYLTKT